ncbi:hypothetical protein NIT7321_03486 [Phaeobacter italicus]|uniref:Uncharacterized protein n=1 Tax=Phaeobacter italicus TaxID=481446 RepID=A0A0H5D7D3_9RHOB|nr:hypothetical protein NIT7321_03486 [Phaeobacter italicus]
MTDRTILTMNFEMIAPMSEVASAGGERDA